MKVIVNKRQSDGQAGSALGDWLEIESCEVKAWFKQPISSLIEHVKELRKDKQIRDIKNIVLVGGFAESAFVKDRFRNEFSGLTLIVPDAAGLAVLRGAVLYGHNPGIVSSRVMSHTYGISLYNDFDGSKHPLEKRILVYGKLRVANCFQIFVRVNESIAVVHEVTHTTIPVDNTTETSFCVYRTLSENPMYTTDPGCELLGKLRIKNIANVPLHDQKHIVTFMFGHSELLVKVKHTLTGDIETLTLDCLQ
ncbi:hypothetical protein DPMN_182825 [Dreissena polymorpha]|uniref:Uncharacterized protein n=2 Tax=Dreissena polymorpha TaxID=45954 RepID=A0A9D4DH18_DREPO|nr:hypothetical protein DPMN_182825 [Dreissena polymorpha]